MTATIGLDMAQAPFPMMTPQETAAVGLKALGRKPSVIPGKQNNLMAFMSKHILSRQANVLMFGGMIKRMLTAAPAQEGAVS